MVYAYLRVSTGKQDGANQKIGIDNFAKSRGLVIDEYIDDEGKSGTLEPEKRELGNLLKKLIQALSLKITDGKRWMLGRNCRRYRK